MTADEALIIIRAVTGMVDRDRVEPPEAPAEEGQGPRCGVVGCSGPALPARDHFGYRKCDEHWVGAAGSCHALGCRLDAVGTDSRGRDACIEHIHGGAADA